MSLTDLSHQIPGQSHLAPMLRAYTAGMHESRFFPNLATATLHLHSTPPFTLAKTTDQGLHLHFWHDPACPLKVHVAVDWARSLGNLFLRYRSLLAAWPLMTVLLVLRRQLVACSSMSFSVGLNIVMKVDLIVVCFVSLGLSIGQVLTFSFGSEHDSSIIEVLLGNRHVLFAGLAPAFLLTSAGLVFVAHNTLLGIISISAYMWLVSRTYLPEAMCRRPQ